MMPQQRITRVPKLAVAVPPTAIADLTDPSSLHAVYLRTQAELSDTQLQLVSAEEGLQEAESVTRELQREVERLKEQLQEERSQHAQRECDGSTRRMQRIIAIAEGRD